MFNSVESYKAIEQLVVTVSKWNLVNGQVHTVNAIPLQTNVLPEHFFWNLVEVIPLPRCHIKKATVTTSSFYFSNKLVQKLSVRTVCLFWQAHISVSHRMMMYGPFVRSRGYGRWPDHPSHTSRVYGSSCCMQDLLQSLCAFCHHTYIQYNQI